MRKIRGLSLLPLTLLFVLGCILTPSTATPAVVNPQVTVPVVGLVVKAENITNTSISYSYTVTNTGVAPLAGPVSIADNKTTVSCPDVKTVGNSNDSLDTNESLVCISSYTVKPEDLTAGSVTNVATATVGGVSSNQVSTTVTFTPPNVLALTKSANPQTYDRVGQVILYTYVVQNKGTVALASTQFTISDNRLGAAFNCGQPIALAPDQTLTCTANYPIVQADMAAGSVINSATASGGGTIVSAPATTTIKLASNPSGLTPGTTISHKVVKDEWMIQIARCYGASFEAVRNANLQVIDPDVIEPDMILTIPNIGSNGTIYAPPCVGYHTVQSGDTWSSIAQRYNADVLVLQEANPQGMAVGTILKVPLNSAGSLSTSVSSTPSSPVSTGPTPTATTIASQATRITFPAGNNFTSVNGTVPAQGNIRYVLSANPGQILNVKVTAPANEVTFAINDAAGATIKPADTALIWSGTLTAGGDYLITLIAVQGANDKQFTMELNLVTP